MKVDKSTFFFKRIRMYKKQKIPGNSGKPKYPPNSKTQKHKNDKFTKLVLLFYIKRSIISVTIIIIKNLGGYAMQKYVCGPCGYEYDPEVGDPDNGIAPGTAFEDLPEDWVCPVCGLGKDAFEPAE